MAGTSPRHSRAALHRQAAAGGRAGPDRGGASAAAGGGSAPGKHTSPECLRLRTQGIDLARDCTASAGEWPG